jgi:hypothetical protein
MYQDIINRLSSESKQVVSKPLETKKFISAAESLKEGSAVKLTFKSLNEVSFPPKENTPKKERIPIIKPATRYPTKITNFDEEIPWL